MKFRVVLAAAACAAILISASSGFAEDVKVDYDHQANFNNYHSYTWGKVDVTDQIVGDRIKHAVDVVLQKKGWQEVPSGGDVVIAAKNNIHNEKEAETFYDGLGGGWGGGWGWGGWGWGEGGGFGEATTTISNVQQGHLMLDIFDAKSKDLLWRGVSRAELSNNPNSNRKKLYSDVDKMFKKFPPKEK